MTVEIPTSEPTRFRAGDTVAWTKSLADFPASDGWILHYRFINQSHKIDVTATASGSDHLVSIAAAVSALYIAGDYTWASWVTIGSDRYTVETGRLTILPDLAAVTAAGFDSRSTAKKTLDLLDSALLTYGANAWTQEYSIAGRTMRFRSAGEFMSLRSKLKLEVLQEENADRIKNGFRPRNRLNVRF
jgi:hypothetical protein